MTQTLVPARASRTASATLPILFVLVLLSGCASATRDGQVALLYGDNAGAAAYFETALAKHPTSVTALVGLGVARYRLGSYADADRALNGLGVAPRLAAYIDRTMHLLHSVPASHELRAYMADGIADQAAWAGELTDAVNAANYSRATWYTNTPVYYVVRSCRCR
jgi:Tetratricopeptide repeat